MANTQKPDWYTSTDEIAKINRDLHKVFLSGKTRSVEYRKNQLKQLAFLLEDNRQNFIDAMRKDLGRPQFETEFGEFNIVIADIVEAIDGVDKWAKTETRWAGMAWATHKVTVRKDPKGTVLVLGAWNYPLTVQLGPLIPAIAAGNTYVLKPSEVAANTAKLFGDLWPKYMDPEMGRIVNGGIPQSTALLDNRWEHIFYTGNGKVGQIVAEKASKFLCPVTLELGGKSPVWVDEHANLDIAAHRILWGKTLNNGQTCIAPDYVIVPKAVQGPLVEALKRVFKEFYPSGAAKSDSYARIINENHWGRINNILKDTKGTIAVGADHDEKTKFLPPTIVTDCTGDDSLLSGEIFGPILPILPVKDVDEAIAYINKNDQPLALYLFSNAKTVEKILNQTRSGSVCVGDVMMQYVITAIPFGGTGPSGYGSYHGKAGFMTFTHERSTVYAPDKGMMGALVEKVLSPRYAPYGKNAAAYFQRVAGRSINFSRPSNPHASVTQVSVQ